MFWAINLWVSCTILAERFSGRKSTGADPVLDFQAMFWSVLIVVRLLMNWGLIWNQKLYNSISFWPWTELAGIRAGGRILENFQNPMKFLNYFLIFPFYFYLISDSLIQFCQKCKVFFTFTFLQFYPYGKILFYFQFIYLINL